MYVPMSHCFPTQTPSASAAVRRGAAITGRHRGGERTLRAAPAVSRAGTDIFTMPAPSRPLLSRRFLRRTGMCIKMSCQMHIPEEVAFQRLVSEGGGPPTNTCPKEVALQRTQKENA